MPGGRVLQAGDKHMKGLGWEPAWDVRGSHCVWGKLKGRVEERGSGKRLGQVVCVSWDISKTLPFTLSDMGSPGRILSSKTT